MKTRQGQRPPLHARHLAPLPALAITRLLLVTLAPGRRRDLVRRAQVTTRSPAVDLVPCRDQVDRAQRDQVDLAASVLARVVRVVRVVRVRVLVRVVRVVLVAVVSVVVLVAAPVVRVRVRALAALVVPVVSVVAPVRVAVARPLVHSARAASRVRVARASARSVKSGTTCRHPHWVSQFREVKGKPSAWLAVHH